MSWLNAAECIGAVLEMSVTGVYRLFELWQDRRIGREVAREREARVEDEKQQMPFFEFFTFKKVNILKIRQK